MRKSRRPDDGGITDRMRTQSACVHRYENMYHVPINRVVPLCAFSITEHSPDAMAGCIVETNADVYKQLRNADLAQSFQCAIEFARYLAGGEGYSDHRNDFRNSVQKPARPRFV